MTFIKGYISLAFLKRRQSYIDFPEKLLEEFAKVKGKKVLQFSADSDLTDYLQLYNDLATIK